MKANDRVYAVLCDDAESISLIGYGTYVGDEVPDEAAAGLAGFLRGVVKVNPRFVMDDGSVVWGCECWWGPQADFENMIAGRKVINVDMAAERVKQTKHVTIQR
jgi:hypothetical protein